MRINTPVVDEEYALPPDEVIITRTDPGARITYANEAFLTSSGFSLEECIGQPHNMVRHPDMPVQAFADLWRTVKSGRPWTGLVKNRRKDGRYYWVRANVSPIVEGGKLQGYMSVRVPATRAEVAAAHAAYAAVRGGAKDLHIQDGVVLRRGLGGWLAKLRAAPAATLARMALIALATWCVVVFWAALLQSADAPLRTVLLWLSPAAAALCVALSGLLQVQLFRPLRSLEHNAIVVASGELEHAFAQDGARELALCTRSLNQMNAKIIGVLRDAQLGVDGFVHATRQIAAGNGELAMRTNAQAATVEEMAASVEEMTAGVQQTADNVRAVKALAEQTASAAVQGQEVMRDVTRTMQDIADSSTRVAAIVNLIDGVAFQTNILAINAAVEAARAGEQGRGFAVVATEVRALAQRAASSAAEIKKLIAASQQSVRAGGEFTDKAGCSMEEIVGSIHSVNRLVGEVAAAMNEQAQGIAQINQAIGQIDQATQQNASLVQEVSSASDELRARSDRVIDALEVFKAGRAGRRAAESPATTTLEACPTVPSRPR